MTAEEFLNKNALLFLSNPEKIMIEFAQYHVKKALEAASEKLPPFSLNYDKQRVLNAYPLENIK